MEPYWNTVVIELACISGRRGILKRWNILQFELSSIGGRRGRRTRETKGRRTKRRRAEGGDGIQEKGEEEKSNNPNLTGGEKVCSESQGEN